MANYTAFIRNFPFRVPIKYLPMEKKQQLVVHSLYTCFFSFYDC